LIAFYPFYYVIITSISPFRDFAANKTWFFPTGLILDNYIRVLRDPNLWNSYRNTVFLVVTITFFHILSCVTIAYPLAMPKLIGRKFTVYFLLIPLFFNGGLIPSFLLIAKYLGLYKSYAAIILPVITNITHLILTRSYFAASIPAELRESAQIDGANHYKILFQIYLPLAVPILAVLAIYCIVNVWNSWFSAALYIPESSKHPLQLYLKRVLIDMSVIAATPPETLEELEEFNKMVAERTMMQYAMIVIAAAPILCIYPFLQKYFVKGIMVGSLKG